MSKPANPAGRHLGRPISPQAVRAVWAAITATPQAPVRELATRLGYSTATINLALQTLRKADYVAFADRTSGARTVLLPFALIAPRGHAGSQSG
jgi:hypothetical protein